MFLLVVGHLVGMDVFVLSLLLSRVWIRTRLEVPIHRYPSWV